MCSLVHVSQAVKRFEKGAERASTRRTRAQQSLSVSPPKAEEVHLIHNLYLQSIKQRRVRSDMSNYDQQVFAMLLQGELLNKEAAVVSCSQLRHVCFDDGYS